MRLEEMFPGESRTRNKTYDAELRHKVETFGGLNVILFGDMLQLK